MADPNTRGWWTLILGMYKWEHTEGRRRLLESAGSCTTPSSRCTLCRNWQHSNILCQSGSYNQSALSASLYIVLKCVVATSAVGLHIRLSVNIQTNSYSDQPRLLATTSHWHLCFQLCRPSKTTRNARAGDTESVQITNSEKHYHIISLL